MTTAWLVYVLAVGILLALGASALAAALRQMGRSTRGVHAVALAGTIALAAIAPRQPRLETTLPSSAVVERVAGAVTPRAMTLGDRARIVRAEVDRAAAALTSAVNRVASPVTPGIALAGWATASMLLLALFIVVNRRILVARRRWPSRALHGVQVRIAPDMGPAVLGFLRAEIVVPRSLLDRPDDEQRLVLAHEREHFRARDHLLLGGAWLGAIAFPWHPAVWYLVNRIRLAIELDCDARVLRGGASPQSYGALLIDMAAHPRSAQIGALALADGASHLERRILAMKAMKGRHVAARAVVLGALGGLLVLAACEATVPTAAEVERLDVGAFEQKATQLALVEAKVAKADYFVNGAPVSSDSARSIVAAKIGSIEVVKSELATGRDTIFVTTTDRMPRERSKSEENLVPFPALGEGGSSDAVLMIDGVEQQPGVKMRLDPKEITSVSVMKPDKDPKYPRGVIVIETKRGTRTAPGEQQLGMKLDETSQSPLRVRAVGPVAAAVSPVDGAPRRTVDPAKPYAITIDGVRATSADVEALEKSNGIERVVVHKRDATDLSNDPAAVNGLMQVISTQRARD